MLLDDSTLSVIFMFVKTIVSACMIHISRRPTSKVHTSLRLRLTTQSQMISDSFKVPSEFATVYFNEEINIEFFYSILISDFEEFWILHVIF